MHELLIVFIFAVGINVLMFIPAFIYKTDKLTDISYALSFIAIATFSLLRSTQSSAHIVFWLAIMVWALRLGAYLLQRILATGKDKRFDGMREDFLRFLRFWVLQGVSVFVILLAVTQVFLVEAPSLGLISFVGITIFLFGLVLETIADAQKWRFIQNPNNKNKWIDEGVWRYSRHPNYLGEMLVWIGVYIAAVPIITGQAIILGLLSPLYIVLLLLFVSGIPLLEKSADQKWGKQKSYQQYKSRVGVLIPKIRTK